MKRLIISVLKFITRPFVRLSFLHYEEIVRRHKIRASKRLFKISKGEVFAGPYKGLRIPQQLGFNSNDLGSILIGEYEKPIQRFLNTDEGWDLFIQLGSGFGINVVGMVFSGKAKKAIGFELDTKMHAIAHDFAVENEVQEVEFFGAISKENILRSSMSWNSKSTLLLCDVEGFEFELFDEDVMSALDHTTIIVEIHEFPSGGGQTNNLIKRAQKYFFVEVIDHYTRELTRVPLLDSIHDDLRFLLLSEGRPMLMQYLILNPRSISH